ncbi:Uncharacterized protein HZ326_16633 [Fusarium oxysporum f. sp. albedinis]|nr:Uncharacterized protein HZ326_16633 [Fusarium oxysporum f. sp. albedinis]
MKQSLESNGGAFLRCLPDRYTTWKSGAGKHSMRISAVPAFPTRMPIQRQPSKCWLRLVQPSPSLLLQPRFP